MPPLGAPEKETLQGHTAASDQESRAKVSAKLVDSVTGALAAVRSENLPTKYQQTKNSDAPNCEGPMPGYRNHNCREGGRDQTNEKQ